MAHFSDVTGRILLLLLFHIFSNNHFYFMCQFQFPLLLILPFPPTLPNSFPIHPLLREDKASHAESTKSVIT